jgi:hypothetical protein
MTAQARPNLGGLFDGSTPADRTSSIAGRLGPRLVTTPAGPPRDDATPASPTVDQGGDVKEPKTAAPAAASLQDASAQRSIDPAVWLDPIRALEFYFGLLQAALDANRHFVMGLAGVLVTGGNRLRGGVDSIRTRP